MKTMVYVFFSFFPELEEHILGDILGCVIIDKATCHRAQRRIVVTNKFL